MAVDVRCNMLCNLGTVLSGSLSDTLLTEGGLISTTGSLELEGLMMPAKGSEVILAYHRPQSNTITRFPRRLRVLRATADPYRNKTSLEIGCKLALMQNKKPGTGTVYPAPIASNTRDLFASLNLESTGGIPLTNADYSKYSLSAYVAAYPPIQAQAVMTYCLGKVGIQRATGARALTFRFLRQNIDLTPGYLSIVNDLLKSECCFAYLTMEEKLMVAKVNLTTTSTAAVLRDGDLIDMQPIQGGEEPADRVVVAYRSVGG